MYYSLYVLQSVCITVCMYYSLYVLQSVCITVCMYYSLYALQSVCMLLQGTQYTHKLFTGVWLLAIIGGLV